MVKLEVVFQALPELTPDFAAMLANRASSYASTICLEREHAQLRMDSLIGLLSLNLRRGMPITVVANGEDAQQAAEDICALMCGRN